MAPSIVVNEFELSDHCPVQFHASENARPNAPLPSAVYVTVVIPATSFAKSKTSVDPFPDRTAELALGKDEIMSKEVE